MVLIIPVDDYTYYPNRPSELESTNLYTFVSWYDVVTKQPGEAKKDNGHTC